MCYTTIKKTLKACNRLHAVGQGMTVEAGNGKSDQGGKVVCWGADYAGQSSPPLSTQKFMVGVSVGWEHSVRYLILCVYVSTHNVGLLGLQSFFFMYGPSPSTCDMTLLCFFCWYIYACIYIARQFACGTFHM
jgi:hypothetical protein